MVMEHNPNFLTTKSAREMYRWVEQRGYVFAETAEPQSTMSAGELDLHRQRDVLVLPA
jgi:hypothetical protein